MDFEQVFKESLIQEQIYSTDRKYYHGASEDKTIYKKYIRPTKFFGDTLEIPMTWLTTNVLYAMEYIGYSSKLKQYDPNGRIYILKLIDKTNIFNIQQNTDRKWLLKELFEKNTQLQEDQLLELFSKDWSLLDSMKRRDLQNIIKKKYEGLFNYENGIYYAPSIGLYNAEKAEIIEEIPSSEFFVKFKKEFDRGYKRAKIILSEDMEISYKNSQKAQVPIHILRESFKLLYSDIIES